ncbi:unnamed protein product [Chondrus crispus]|uniref:Uncharacterized protein n=1 Tax=Chondrus crispus TaxID=2769 RepID=R7QLE8_CHOCR|nr:unnamed protein product [Chondrus crispus]CDF39327.1 unnamed protein product [Chondrus crispus]|eukprot:XP_005719238.1 unnamed protein product [Chondrus crispus]
MQWGNVARADELLNLDLKILFSQDLASTRPFLAYYTSLRLGMERQIMTSLTSVRERIPAPTRSLYPLPLRACASPNDKIAPTLHSSIPIYTGASSSAAACHAPTTPMLPSLLRPSSYLRRRRRRAMM